MKKSWFNLLYILSLLSLNSCNHDQICGCKEACTVSEEGQLSCNLDEKAFNERKEKFEGLFFSEAEQVKEKLEGFEFVFPDKDDLNERLFEFILTEKKCCPFFQYDIKVLPFGEGIHLTISGDEEVKAFLKELL